MRKKTVILISGYKRSGKDFISNLLKQGLSNATTYSFAGPLKDIIATTFGISLNLLDNYKNENKVLFIKDDAHNIFPVANFRQVLQRFGNEAIKKHFGPDVWADMFLAKAFSADTIIISDWRFMPEYHAVNYKYNVITIRVVDNNIKNADIHESETALDNFTFDYYIDNTDKDDSIQVRVSEVINSIKAKHLTLPATPAQGDINV